MLRVTFNRVKGYVLDSLSYSGHEVNISQVISFFHPP